MLHVLFYVNSAGSFDKLIDTEGGAQQDRLDGGAQLLPWGSPSRWATGFGSARRCGGSSSGGDAVRVVADGVEVEAERAIVALPPAIAARIEFDPPLPEQRRQLAERLRPGR